MRSPKSKGSVPRRSIGVTLDVYMPALPNSDSQEAQRVPTLWPARRRHSIRECLPMDYSHVFESAGLNVSAFLLLVSPFFIFVVGRRRASEEFASVDASAALQIAFVALCGLWVLYRMPRIWRRTAPVLFAPPAIYVTLLMILAFISTAWSMYPSLTLYRSLEACVYLLLIIDVLTSRKNADDAVRFILLYSIFVILSYALIAGQAKLAAGEFGRLVFRENKGAFVSGIGLLLSMIFVGRHPIRSKALACFFVVAMFWTNSSATFLSVLAALITVFIKGRKRLTGLALLGILLLYMAVNSDSLYSLVRRTVFFNRSDETIQFASGRKGLWQAYWEGGIRESPWIGNGFEAGEHQQVRRGVISNAHNTFVATQVNLGLLGLILLFLLVFSMIRAALCISGRPGVWLLGACVCAWINSMSIPTITSKVRPTWIVFAALCILITLLRRAQIAALIWPQAESVAEPNSFHQETGLWKSVAITQAFPPVSKNILFTPAYSEASDKGE